MITQTRQPHVNRRHDDVVRFLGLPTAIRASAATTGGAFGLTEHWAMAPGFGSPYHTHQREDETFYVLEGEVAFVVDGAWTRVGAGGYVFGPRAVPHGFMVTGDAPARLLLMATPGGFEAFVRVLAAPIDAPPTPPDMAAMMAAAARFDVDIHGPLPEPPADMRPGPSRDRAALDRLRAAHVAAMNAGDAAACAAVFTDDAVQLPPHGPANLGRAAITHWLAGFLAAFQARLDIVPADVRIAGDVAVERGTYSLELTATSGAVVVDAGKYVTVYERLADGDWRTAQDIWNSDAPLP